VLENGSFSLLNPIRSSHDDVKHPVQLQKNIFRVKFIIKNKIVSITTRKAPTDTQISKDFQLRIMNYNFPTIISIDMIRKKSNLLDPILSKPVF
jgi:hypothetical protein